MSADAKQSAEQSLRILFVINLPWDMRLGAVRVYMELAEQWRAGGHTVDHFSLSDAFPNARESRAGFAVRQVLFAYKAAAFVKRNRVRYDVIDALIGSLAGSKEKLGFNGLLVARSVGLYRLYDRFERSPEGIRGWPRRSRGKFLGRILYGIIRQWRMHASDKAVQHADIVNLPNEKEAACLNQDLASDRPILVQPYGLTDERSRALLQAAAPASGRLANPRVGFIGMWGPRKGADDWGRIVRRIWEEIPDARFSFLGTMVAPQAVLSDLGLEASARIDVVPDYSPESLPKLLADCTVGAFPSYVEGFGLAVLEQLAAALPTVAFDTPGPRDILGARLPELLVPRGDIDEFASAICKILRLDQASYQQLSQRSAEAAAQFRWSKIAEDTLEIYRRRLLGHDVPLPRFAMSARPFVVVSTRLPPQICGIGTFSWLLHQHWPNDISHVQFLVVEGAAQSAALLNHRAISEFKAKTAKLSCALDNAGDADVLLHYAARAYHPYGCPILLPAVFAKWKRKYPGGRLLILFHELPNKLPIASRHYWIGLLNRHIIRKLACLADVIVTNTSDHVTKIERISGRADVHLVRVGSNIVAPDNLSQERMRTEFVIFGLPFGRWQTLQMFDSEIRTWQKNGRLTRLHLIGPRDEKFDLRSEKLIATWADPSLVTRHGMLPSSEVSRLLARVQFGLSNVTLENWSKSTAFMAYASHGCAIVGKSPADRHASAPLCFTISPDEVATISDADLTRLTQTLKEWHRQNADWNIIARKISALLLPGGQAAADEIAIIAPESIPGAGGVTDYILKLVEHWPQKQTRFVFPKVFRGRGAKAILQQLFAGGSKLFVQYSAYGFDRTGYPRSLVRALIEWKTKTHGRLVIMFHEIWTFWPILNKNFIVQFLHRRAIKRLLKCADVVFTSTSSQAEHLTALNSRAQVRYLPVGSNIECLENVDSPRKPGWAVVFGLQPARIRTLKEMQSSLRSLIAAGRIRKIITVGANGDGSGAERSILSRLELSDGFEQRGPQSEREISELLLTASFGIFGQDELSYSKSTTFMAYAAHGLNILAECADRSKPEPLSLLVDPVELLQGISDAELKVRAERLCAWQKRTSSWNTIALEFAAALQSHSRETTRR